jgi:hypothetical protein
MRTKSVVCLQITARGAQGVPANVWVETLVHTLDPDDLIWGGRSRTVNANHTAALFAEVASAAAREIERAGLLKAPAAAGAGS